MMAVWVVRNKVTKEHWHSNSGKASWVKRGHAKNAWNLKHSVNFLNQDKYEVVDIVAECEEFKGYMQHFIESALPDLSDDIQALGEEYLTIIKQGK